MERFGFSTLGCSGASLAEVLATARRHGCGGVELRAAADEFLHTGIAAADRERVRAAFAEARVVPLAVCSYVRLCAPGFGAGSPEDEQVGDLLAHLDLARTIGARGVRVFMRDDPDAAGDGPTPGERRAVRRVAEVARHTAGTGVRVLVETHDSHSLGERVARFMALLDAELPGHGCGVVWDTAHTWSHGESPARSLELLRPWIAHVQVKDLRSVADPVPVPLGAGTYPVAELAGTLAGAGWDGALCLEWERKWHPELPPIDDALAAARTWAAPLLERNART